MPKKLPFHPNLENLKKQAKQLAKGHKDGQVEAFARIKTYYPKLSDASVNEILAADFSLCNAQLVVAREYGFATWQELSEAVVAPETSAIADALLAPNPGLRWIEEQVALLAPVDIPLLICGESGTGKMLAARTLHRLSKRKDGPFLQVYCGQEHQVLVASELFGHEEGAFTGARAQRVGKVELGGTLFLDEVKKLDLDLQAQLYALLKEGTFQRVGGVEELQADVRIVAATHEDLDALVQAGSFRGDLALLLKRAMITMPSLRERREKIPELAAYFARQMAKELGKRTPSFSAEALKGLQAHDWPGNVNELELRVHRAVVSCGEGPIEAEHIALK